MTFRCFSAERWAAWIVAVSLAWTSGRARGESLGEIAGKVGAEASAAYAASPFSALSKDYFLRFSRSPEAKAAPGEVEVDDAWKIVLPADADPLAELMAAYFAQFMGERMRVELPIERRERTKLAEPTDRAIVLLDSGGGAAGAPESFTLRVGEKEIRVAGADAHGLRDGIVRLADLIGFREAPVVKPTDQVFTPRLKVRLGTTPSMGSVRDLVFLGYNAVFAGGGSLYSISNSDAIPELAARRQPGALEAGVKAAAEARRHGMKTYGFVDIRQKFPKDDPVFAAHPEIRGALTWKADGEYTLCTEHPLVQQWLRESARGVFEADPQLDGMVLIIGGEGFYHCFMRPYGVKKGHTNCARCEALGAETVVANLVNLLASAAREAQPKAEVIAWPYSAEHVWSADPAQAGFIEKLKPGTGIFSEIEKDEYVEKPEGVRKHLWDYSIDLIGPGERAKKQIAACRAAGIPIYLKSEPELGFEAPRLPHIPCMDRWADRAEALASCGADGAWVFPAFRPCYGTSAAELNKHFWWNPAPPKEELLKIFAARLFGAEAGKHSRSAWKLVSEAIEHSPELPSYYTGPYYVGPAHPMCADPDAKLPESFYGYYFFMAEIADAEGLKKRPIFVTKPTGNVPVFGRYYRKMEELLKQAADEMNAARPAVDERHRLMFESEDSAVQWFYRTARTEANFYESCQLRELLRALAAQPERTAEEKAEAERLYKRWRAVLADELENAEAALPLVQKDVRLDFHFGGDHSFDPAAAVIAAKIEILKSEIDTVLPRLAATLGLSPR